MKNFTIKKYEKIADIFASSIEADELEEDLSNYYIEGVDVDNELHTIAYEQWEEGIKEQGIWGFVDGDNVIHYWVGKELTTEELIHFFAHEIGHNTGKQHKDFLKEELRAESYALVAKLAYQMAIKNK